MQQAMIRNYIVIAKIPQTSPPVYRGTTLNVASCTFNNISSLSAPIFQFERFGDQSNGLIV